MTDATTDPAEFDLNHLIRETLAGSREPDPRVVARRLVSRIPDHHVREALGVCLPDRVREVARTCRVDAPETPSALPAGRSWRAGAASMLRQRYPVDGGWKFLGDCTAADCESIAAEYARRKAEQAAVEARFRRLASELRRAGAATVADLDESTIEEAA